MSDDRVPGASASAAAGEPHVLCDCNSGLSAGRCCAFDLKTAPPPASPDLEAEAADVALRGGNHAEAARPAIEVLEAAPRRYARTASYAQVTEKLYDRSVFRHRRYLRHLEPALPILAPPIERLGYAAEA